MKKLYYNGNIITMEDEGMSAKYLVEEKGNILYVGDHIDEVDIEEIEKIDLQGKTLMPSFIDAHSHIIGVAAFLLNVGLNEVSTFEEMERLIHEYIEEKDIQPGEWITCSGYDNNNFKDRYTATKWDLDKICKTNPIAVQHITNHTGVFNSLALEKLGIDADTKAPEGGVIEKRDGEVTGYLEENAYMKYIGQVPSLKPEEIIEAMEEAQTLYASHGITTAQEGAVMSSLGSLYKHLATEDKLWLDIVGYATVEDRETIKEELDGYIGEYKNNFKIGGYKIFLDGSLQVETGWVKEPYLGTDNFTGYPTLRDEEVLEAVNAATKDNLQILAHCNGDMAAQQFIDACKKSEDGLEDLKPVMIHAQLLDTDQLDDVKELGMIPSFFIGHIYYWGDTHILNFGKERVDRISLSNSAKDHDILFTYHQDAPVTKPDMFHSIWSGVNRLTKDGVCLGEAERVPVIEALKAVTINSAYQYSEEDTKGSLAKGKYADMIIVSKNPLEVEKSELKDIEVLKTIKRGKTIYSK